MKILKRHSFLGLEMGSPFIKGLQLQKNKKELILNRFGALEIPPGTIVKGKIEEPISLAEQVALLVKNISYKGKKVAVSLSKDCTYLRRFTFPQMSKKELAEVMKYEVIKHINIPLDDLIYNYLPLKEGEEKGLDVILAAVSREVANKYMEAVTKAGLFPQILESEILALIRTCNLLFNKSSELFSPPPKEDYIIMDIGEESTSLVMVEKGSYAFHRNISVGAPSLQGDIKDLEGGTGNEQGGLRLLEEIYRTLDYYLYKKDNPKIGWKGILITGEVTGDPGFDSWLSRELDIPSHSLDPLNYLELNGKNLSLEYIKGERSHINTPLGLALGRWENGQN